MNDKVINSLLPETNPYIQFSEGRRNVINMLEEILTKCVLGELKRKLGILEGNLSGSDPWVTGAEISIADIAIWRTMGWMVSGTVDGFPKNLLEEFPNIKRVCKSVDTHPKVLEWISLTYPRNYSRGSF